MEYNAQVTLISGTATISNGRFSPNSIILVTPQTNRTLVSGTSNSTTNSMWYHALVAHVQLHQQIIQILGLSMLK